MKSKPAQETQDFFPKVRLTTKVAYISVEVPIKGRVSFNAKPRRTITVDVSYVTPQAHRIINVALHQEYSPSIVFLFSHGRKDLYHV
jgi:predicted nicotinamide N-methyase